MHLERGWKKLQNEVFTFSIKKKFELEDNYKN